MWIKFITDVHRNLLNDFDYRKTWSSIQTCTLDGHLHRKKYARYRINAIDSPDDEHRGVRNM